MKKFKPTSIIFLTLLLSISILVRAERESEREFEDEEDDEGGSSATYINQVKVSEPVKVETPAVQVSPTTIKTPKPAEVILPVAPKNQTAPAIQVQPQTQFQQPQPATAKENEKNEKEVESVNDEEIKNIISKDTDLINSSGSIELEEANENNEAIFTGFVTKNEKILGLIPTQIKTEVKINAKSGEVISKVQNFWNKVIDFISF